MGKNNLRVEALGVAEPLYRNKKEAGSLYFDWCNKKPVRPIYLKLKNNNKTRRTILLIYG